MTSLKNIMYLLNTYILYLFSGAIWVPWEYHTPCPTAPPPLHPNPPQCPLFLTTASSVMTIDLHPLPPVRLTYHVMHYSPSLKTYRSLLRLIEQLCFSRVENLTNLWQVIFVSINSEKNVSKTKKNPPKTLL